MDTKVDVVVVTKDPLFEFHHRHQSFAMFRQGYEQITFPLGGIPINNLIIETSTPLAKARQRAIQKVTTDWFVFLDDDIILPDDWWKAVEGMRLLGRVGAIQGTAMPIGLGEKYDRAFKDHFFEKEDWPKWYWQLNGNSRLYTHNTLIRTEAVRDWNPPDDLEAYEDYHLMRHIQKKGFRCFVVKTETYHKYSWSKLWPMGRWGTRGMLRFFPKSEVVKRFAAIPLEYLRHGFRIGTVNAVKQTAGLYELIVGGR